MFRKVVMLSTERKPVSVGEMLTGKFLIPMKLMQGALAEAMGVESASWSARSATAAARLWRMRR
jgi:hypothetical protein